MAVAPQDYVKDPRFNNKVELPPTSFTSRNLPFNVAYAGYGYRNATCPEEERVFLFFGPLMGSRLVHIAKDELARRHKIRIIHPDRPGVGGTDPAKDAHSSMRLWREVILALLRHLDIQHVSGIGCHSGGTISAIDMLIHHPEILDPERTAYLAIGAPWILPKHTGVTRLSLVQKLPTCVIGHTDKAARLINNHIGPLLDSTADFSLKLLRGAKLILSSPRSPSGQPKENSTDNVHDALGENGDHGDTVAARFEDELWPHIIERVYVEGIRGVGADAVLFMQKGMKSGWSEWGDYDTGVKRLISALDGLEPRSRTGRRRRKNKRLKVAAFYAEHDDMIGPGGVDGKSLGKGPRWFDRCWEAALELMNEGESGGDGGGDEDGLGGNVEYRAMVVGGADHDDIWDLKWGVPQAVFKRMTEEKEQEEEGVQR